MALLDVVEWKNKPGEVIFKFPEGAVSLGGQLIVMENQEAILFKEGRALDSFGPGRHTLKTGNIPILEKLINLPFGGKSPFPAEVYFVNKTEIPNLQWGTKVPMNLMDPIYNIAIPLRAFGAYSIKIQDTKGFLMAAIGTWQAMTTESISSSMRDMIILSKLQDLISEFMIKNNVTILKLPAFYEEMSLMGKSKLVEEFASFGLELVRFNVQSVNFPEEDESVKRLKKALADKAEINIMGDDYNRKRTFDTMEKAAGNEGMGGAAMGAGMGFGMGNTMGTMAQNLMNTGSQVKCPHCGTMNAAGAKFCSSCGKEMTSGGVCPACKAAVAPGAKFCPACGASLAEGACTKCKAKLAPGAKFCPECGAAQ